MWHGTVKDWFWYWLGGLHVMCLLAARDKRYDDLNRGQRAVKELERMRIAALLQSYDPVLSWE